MKWKRTVIIAGVVTGVFFTMKYALPVLLPFLFGGLFAMALIPVSRWLASRKLCRRLHFTESGIGAFLILGISVGGILAVMWLLQVLSGQVGRLVEWYPVAKKEFYYIIGECCQQAERAIGIPARESSSYIYTQLNHLSSYMLKGGQSMEAAVGSVKKCVVFVAALILSVVSAVLILQEYRNWKPWVERYPVLYRAGRVFRELWTGIKEYIKAQFKIMGIIMVICVAGLFILGTPHFIWAGLGLGLLDALPVLGTGTFLVPAALVLAIRSNVAGAVICLLLYLITACVRQFLEPRIIGRQVGVSPLLVLLSVYLGLYAYGGIGFLLGPLSALVIYGILKEWRLLEPEYRESE